VKKINLSKERLRVLTSKEAGLVAGGLITRCSCYNDPGCPVTPWCPDTSQGCGPPIGNTTLGGTTTGTPIP
jgi:hypothetical protein